MVNLGKIFSNKGVLVMGFMGIMGQFNALNTRKSRHVQEPIALHVPFPSFLVERQNALRAREIS